MSKVRVLVVDDALLVRKMVTDILEEDPDIEVVGVAGNGKIALNKVAQLNPDVITLDIEMPVMDGIETLKALRGNHCGIPVIMCSSITETGASSTLEALALGARDYVTKPMKKDSFAEAKAELASELIPKVRYWGSGGVLPPVAAPAVPSVHEAPVSPAPVKPCPSHPVKGVVIGVSTGGPEALDVLFAGLPGNFPVPILIVQHMPPVFTRLLAERLDSHSDLVVREACSGDEARPGTALLAPGGKHMEVEAKEGGYVVGLNENPPENSCRPAVDVLFRSAASVFGGGTLAAVLTGMGRDGLAGAREVLSAGGTVYVQDEPSSVVWGMPGAIVEAGLPATVLPLEQMAGGLVRRVGGAAHGV